MLIAEMPEAGRSSDEQAAALTGLARIVHGSGAMRGKCAIAGGRRLLRYMMLQDGLVASHHNPVLKIVVDRLPKDFDAEIYKGRNMIERFFARLKASFRRIATRYEKTSRNFLAMIKVV